MPLVVVDTDILIDVSRNDRTAIQYVSNLEKSTTVTMSAVTAMELIVGCRNKIELVRTEKFLKRFQLIHISEQISERAVDLLRAYNLSHGLLMPDAVIAATALTANQPLATKNQRDFRFIGNLTLLTYP